ncbi:MAG: hypothetical protein RR343_06490, partial [Oscillospiraceae bacterium]
MSKRNNSNGIANEAKCIAKNISTTVTDVTIDIAVKAKDSIVQVKTKAAAEIKSRQELTAQQIKNKIDKAISLVENSQIVSFIVSLGDSPVVLTKIKIDHIKSNFPIPQEQTIIWADAEFDLRPSGIALTEKGLFIKTNTTVFKPIIKTSNFLLNELNEKEQQAYLQHQNQFCNGKSVLLYYDWNDFDSRWFIDESGLNNKALLVEPQCSKRFVETCRVYSAKTTSDKTGNIIEVNINDEHVTKNTMASIVAGSAVQSGQNAIFAEQKSHINTPAGHGEFAEEYITLLDKINGLDAKVVGRDNAKNGADRQIGEILIQTKYYNSAKGSVEACFDAKTGFYKYIKDGRPMQLEVPKDQYDRALQEFKNKITAGKVSGITNPDEAVNIIREGRITYEQAINLTKPGTIESLSYDALTGVVTCSCAFGISFVVTAFLAWRKTGDINTAIKAGTSAGLQVFGLSFVQHILVSQIARTSLANSLMAPSQFLVSRLGYQTSATIVNGIRTLSGKSAIHGIAASKHLAKILRSNVITSALSFAVFSIPDTYNVVNSKISMAQYTKNISVLGGAIAAGAGGSIVAGMSAAKIAGIAGTTVAPGVGTAVGIVGGFAGGMAGSQIIKLSSDILCEDDIVATSRLFNAYLTCMVGE